MHKKLQVKALSDINPLERGFTLIEILVTITIIAVITSMSLLLFNPPSDQTLKNESSKLQSLIQMASDEAIIQGKEIGIEFIHRGYRFLDLDPFTEIWNTREDDHIFRERYFSEGINVDIKLENNEIEIRGKKENKLQRLFPHIILFSSGEISPFLITLAGENGELMIEAKINGTITTKEL
tara:strand:- start:5389 stop:5931 length:543 start_codon:yes stop_codon:yes gene_type:complete